MLTRANCLGCHLNGGRISGHGEMASPDVAFVCSYPSHLDVTKGKFLCGSEGKLLRELLTSEDFDLTKVYFTGALMCCPEKGAKIKSSDIAACSTRLIAELKAVDPKIVVTLGDTAAQALLGNGPKISKRRGKFHKKNGFSIVPTLSPDGVINSPESFPDFVHDIQYVRSILEGEEPVVQPCYDKYVIIEDQRYFDHLMFLMKHEESASVDLETASLDFIDGHILCMGISWKRGTACVLDWQKLIQGNAENFARLKESLERVKCVFHNGQFDTLWLRHRGIDPNYYMDTMLAHYALDERQGKHSLKRLATAYYRAPEYDASLKSEVKNARPGSQISMFEDLGQNLFAADDEDPNSEIEASVDEEDRKAPLSLTLDDWKNDKIRTKIMKYCGADADYTFRLSQDLRREMIADDVLKVHDLILIPAARHFTWLELSGLLVDRVYHDEIGRKWSEEVVSLEAQMRAFPGAEKMNLNSPKQVTQYLFKTLGLRQMGGNVDNLIDQDNLLREIQEIEDPEAQDYWKGSSSKIFSTMKTDSTSTYMLYWLAQQHEFPRLMVRHRIASKLSGTYYNGYKNVTWKDGKVRPRYRIHGTRTGRISSTDPNIHGMPRKKEIKDIFIADPGFKLIAADYSQAEIRMVAHFAHDRRLIKAMAESDIHKAIAKDLFNITDEQLKSMPEDEYKLKRRAAKTIAFGLIYGRGAKGLAPQIGVSEQEAEVYIEKFFTMMPDVRRWIAKQKEAVLRDHEVVSIYGKKRRFPFIADRQHRSEVLRQAVNMPVQSSVSDMTLLANIKILKILSDRGIEVRPWPHIHDGFLFQVDERYVDEAVEVTRDVLHDVGFPTEVHFAAEIEVGDRWGEMKVVYSG